MTKNEVDVCERKLTKKEVDYLRRQAAVELCNIAVAIKAKFEGWSETERKEMYKAYMASSDKTFPYWPGDLKFNAISRTCLTEVHDNLSSSKLSGDHHKREDRKWKNERFFNDKDWLV